MTSPFLDLAQTTVRVWTRLYTSGLPARLRQSRRAEIESDLFESRSDERHTMSPAVQVMMRLLLGIPDDVQWRLVHATAVNNVVAVIVALTTTMLLLVALWMVDLLKARTLPVPPSPQLVMPAPPMAPRPSV
jgi:hypothetical protein